MAGTQQDPSVSRMKNKSVLIPCSLFPSPDIYSAKRTLMLTPFGPRDPAPDYPENRREHPCLAAWANWEISVAGTQYHGCHGEEVSLVTSFSPTKLLATGAGPQ